MSQYSLHDITTRAELDGFIEVVWKAWSDPYMPQIRIALPVFGYTAEAKAQAIAASKARVWGEIEKLRQTGNISQRWVYAKHDASGDIVGGIRLDSLPGSPFPSGCPKMNIYWWPQGEEVAEFCAEMMQQVFTPRSMWMQRAHGTMLNFVVDPKHRGKGVGTLLMNLHTRELDERGIEGFVESSPAGRSVYEKAGYQVVMKVDSYIPAGKSDDWKRWHHEFGVRAWYAMWRPVKGVIEHNTRTKPWQQGPSLPIDN